MSTEGVQSITVKGLKRIKRRGAQWIDPAKPTRGGPAVAAHDHKLRSIKENDQGEGWGRPNYSRRPLLDALSASLTLPALYVAGTGNISLPF